jgi:hypothetical protein
MGYFATKSTTDPTQQAVLKQMDDGKFHTLGVIRSFMDFYTGETWSLSISLFTLTAVTWMLSGLSAREPRGTLQILWPLLFSFIGTAYIAYRYFFSVPALQHLLNIVLTVIAIIQLRKVPAATQK